MATATAFTNLGKAVFTNRIKGGGTEPAFIGIGTGATAISRTAAATDTALATPSGSRIGPNGTNGVVSSQQTTTTTNDTYRVVGTFTPGTAVTYDESGLFDATTAGNLCLSSTFPGVNLLVGDQIEITMQVVLP
jgi:hypothetical protein